ncbi:MAG TPA: hypothetical protein VLX68_00575 [Chitinivibrionales bacterium]|nr:hypothetical protein [Chitinivibrionales bacterium]
MNIFKEYRTHLLQKKPQSPSVQYFWLAASAVIAIAAVCTLNSANVLRSVLMIAICVSLAADAVTNLAYYKNRELFEKLVNVKIAANIICLLFIIAFLVLSAKFRLG